MRPIGKTKTSLRLKTLDMRQLSGLKVTKPTQSVPSRTIRICGMRISLSFSTSVGVMDSNTTEITAIKKAL
ncbi:hypothetical protein QQP08_018075 [Theobroma cacao]|nr:hypothetical protein QQP08_018075 [Theobroma cacao]